MKNFLYENRIFLSLYLLFLVIGGVLIGVYEKGDEIIYVNSLHHSFFNNFFKWITQLAEFPAMLLMLLVVFFYRFGNGLILGINSFFIFATVQVCKRVIFANEVRPSVFFEGKTPLDFVEGVEIARYHSFPSGHSAIAFSLLFMLSILIKDKRWGFLLFTIALLVAASRVYLLQHFLRDIYFGSLIGVVVTAIVYMAVISTKQYKALKWKDKALFK